MDDDYDDDERIVVYVANRANNTRCPEDMTLQIVSAGFHETVLQIMRATSAKPYGVYIPQAVAPTLCSLVKMGGDKRPLGDPWFRMEMTLGELRAIMEAEHGGGADKVE